MSEHRLLGYSVGELLSAEIDRALSAEESTALHAHLLACEMCRNLRASLLSVQTRVRVGEPRANEVIRAQQESLARIITVRQHTSLVATLAHGALVVAAALVAIVALAMWPRTPSANPAIPERELVATRTSDTALGTVTLTIEQGRFAARPRQNIGVTTRAEIRLNVATEGSAQIRIEEPGETYGILATTPNVAGATLVRLDGALPPLDPGESHDYKVWVHLETTAGMYDSEPLLIRVEGSPDGERARLP